MTALTVSTLSTPPGSVTARITADAVVAAVNGHASQIDTLTATIGGTLTADAEGRAKIAADFFNAATLLSAIADGAFANDAATRALFADNIWTAAKLATAVTAKIPGTHTLTPAAQVGTARAVAIQLKDIAGTNVAAKTVARVWLSDAAGGAPTGGAPDGGLAVSVGVSLAVVTAGKVVDVITDANGAVTVTLTHAGADTTWFVNVAVGSSLVSSAAVLIDN